MVDLHHCEGESVLWSTEGGLLLVIAINSESGIRTNESEEAHGKLINSVGSLSETFPPFWLVIAYCVVSGGAVTLSRRKDTACHLQSNGRDEIF
ncbi:hypothetical protein TNCV_1115841 [Trichonephila clavipes]|nr:hypothetical protein TNCV_1115841 [Trichonephila clavipes]